MHAHTLGAAAGVDVTLCESVLHPLLSQHLWVTRIEGFCTPTHRCVMACSWMCGNINQTRGIEPEECMMEGYRENGHLDRYGDYKETRTQDERSNKIPPDLQAHSVVPNLW